MTKVKNAPNTGDLKAPDYTEYSSWIEYWEANRYNIRLYKLGTGKYKCPKCGGLFAWSEFDGAHIIKVDSVDSKKYILPLCQGCNRGKDETPFDVDNNLLLPMPNKKR